MTRASRLAALVALLFAVFATTAARAATAAAAPSAPAPAANALTTEDVSAYFDGMLPAEMKRADIAGAVIVVVKDGQILFERGYGLADVKAGRPVDPDATLFRPGSISKLFMWTAVMQLVEAGKLDLDADINRYLDFKVPPYDGKPMTMRQLMTHSAGFADTSKDLFPPDLKSLKPLSRMAEVPMPARIFPPGTTPAYSNYGASLAGYIVQRVSGQPFDDYIEQHIFAPLGMTHSTFRQPLPQGWSANMSKGYRTASGRPGPFELVQMPPAGALSTTGSDLSRFMIAHLQDGEFQGQRILSAVTAQQMHSLQFQPAPPLPGMALGFYQERANGHRVIGHAGDTGLFHSDLHLFLDDHVGLYISLNSAGTGGAGVLGTGLRTLVFKGFSDRYFPAAQASLPTWPSAKADGQVLAGNYIHTGRSDAGWARIGGYLLGQTTVATDPDGVVTVSSFRGANQQVQRWREIGPFQYQAIGGASRMAAVVKDGKPVLILHDDYPPVDGLQPVPVTMSAAWNLPLLKVSAAILAIAAVTWPLAAAVRRAYGHRFELTGLAAWLHRLTRADAVVWLGFAWLWYWLMGQRHLGSQTDWIIRLIQLVGVLAIVGTAAPLANAVEVWRNAGRGLWAKVSSAAIAASCLAAIWFVISLKLITLQIAY